MEPPPLPPGAGPEPGRPREPSGGTAPAHPAHVDLWHAEIGLAPSRVTARLNGRASITRFRDIDPRIEQPALDVDILSIHLDGPKRIVRRQGLRALERDVAEDALTLMPANEAFRWETFGPVGFAHLVIDAADLRAAAAETGHDPAMLRLEPFVGLEDPRLAGLLGALMTAQDRPWAGRLYAETLSATLAAGLLRHAWRAPGPGVRLHLGRTKLATWQLRRVDDHMRAHLAEDIGLAELVALSGVGRARFFRGFRASMGRSPFEHLLSLRLLRARTLLLRTSLPVTGIAGEVGLDPSRLAAAFRARYGMTPSGFRRSFGEKIAAPLRRPR